MEWTEEQRITMIAHVLSVWPEEGCGFLAGRDSMVMRVYPVENKLHSPVRYEMDPEQQVAAMMDIEEQEWEILAIYHSHPHGPARLSPTDLHQARVPDRDELRYPGVAMIVISLVDRSAPIVRCFRIEPGHVLAEALRFEEA